MATDDRSAPAIDDFNDLPNRVREFEPPAGKQERLGEVNGKRSESPLCRLFPRTNLRYRDLGQQARCRIRFELVPDICRQSQQLKPLGEQKCLCGSAACCVRPSVLKNLFDARAGRMQERHQIDDPLQSEPGASCSVDTQISEQVFAPERWQGTVRSDRHFLTR